MYTRRVAATGLLFSLAMLLLSCTSLPPDQTASDRGKGPGESPSQFPGLWCCDVSGLRFWFTGDTFMQRAEELIRSARDYILIDSFLIIDDEKTERIFELLLQKMDENVRVYLITDASSGYVPGRPAIPLLVESGIPITEYNPIRGNRVTRLPLFLQRDHRKFWLIDGQSVVLGGQNIYSVSLNSPAENGNTDTMVEFRSATAARELRDAFVREWNAYSMNKLRKEDFIVPPEGGGEQCLWLVHQDRLTKPVVGEMFSRLMDKAEREIWLIQSYALPDRSILRRIRKLTDAGVTVNIIYSSTFHTLDKFFYSTGYRMIDLIEAGARLWAYGSTTSHLHYKAVIVDEHWFAVGSANLNYRSAHLSKELNILFEGREMGAAMLDNLEELKANSRRISAEKALSYRGLRFLFYYLFLFFGG
jgi:cardiolipin synthase